MSSLTPHTGIQSKVEPAGASSSLPLPAVLEDNGVDGFDFVTTGFQDAAFVDVDGSGAYELLSLADRLFLVSDGSGGLTLATSGTVVAQFIDDGSGGYAISSDLSGPEAAVMYQSQDGSYWLVNAALDSQIRMLAADSSISFFT